MNTNLIELREKNHTRKGDNHINGQFECIFDKSNLKLEKNDELRIRSCFLDTRAANGDRIEINTTNNEFSIGVGYYIRNIENNADFTYTGDDALPAQNFPDGKGYVLSYGSVGSTDVLELKEFQFNASGGEYDSFDGTFQITPVHPDLPNTIVLHFKKGQGNIVKAQLPKNKGTDNFDLSGIFYKTSVGNTSFNQDDFNLINPSYDDLEDKYSLDNPNDQSGEVEGVVDGDYLFPLINNFTFEIPQGSYTQDAISKLITDKMIQYKQNVTSKLNFTPDPDNNLVNNYPTKNAFMTSFKQLQIDPDYGIDVTIYTNFYLVREDGGAILEVDRNSVNNYLIGANQISLSFDETLNKFLFLQNHTNIFNSDNSAIVKYVQNSGNNYFLAGDYSGIFINSMSTKTQELLFNQMGFNSSILTTITYDKTLKSFGAVLTNSRVFSTHLVVGETITSNLSGVDASVNHNENFNIVPALSTLNDITSIEVSSIIAENNQAISELNEGYFLIEISGLPNTNIINNPLGKIQQIVSKYYQNGDFTISENGSGSITYIHNSEIPLNISKVMVRILDPSNNGGSAAEQLGNNNTIFLEVIKNNSN